MLHAESDLKAKVPVEEPEIEQLKRWTVVPSYSYSFFNKGLDSWQEEILQIYYQANRQLVIGGEIDILQRPPSGTDIYYSALAAYYPWNWLELHGKISLSPDPNFAAKQIYAGGLAYQVMPRLSLISDYQRFNFIQGSIDQFKTGVTLGITDEIFLSLRYVRGWAFSDLEYNYYSASLDFMLPGKRRLNLAFSYGTDPDSEIGSNGTAVDSLSPAYTYSVFFTQPIRKDLSLFLGAQYTYRLKASGGELYQQMTPTVGLSWKF